MFARPASQPATRLVARVALPVVAVAALAACGSSGQTGAGAGESGQGAGAAQTVRVAHNQGTTEVPVAPQRVAVMDFGVLDSVDALADGGWGGEVVAIPKQALPDSLSDYRGDDVVNAGTMQEPDIEALAEADPDVILVAGRSAPKYKELAEVAPTVDLSLDNADYLGSFQEQSLTIGRILGQEPKAQELLDGIDTKIADAKKQAEKAGTGLTVLTSGSKVSAYGSGSRFALIHDIVGVKPAVTDLKQDSHGQAVSFEFIAEAAPQHLFVVDRDAAIGQSGKAAKQVLDNALVAGTPAWKDGKVAYLDGQRWYIMGGGLTNVPAMIDEITAAL